MGLGDGCTLKKKGDRAFGIEAAGLTPDAYQQMIDRGWRRSGNYCYKPSHTSCCVKYTIRYVLGSSDTVSSSSSFFVFCFLCFLFCLFCFFLLTKIKVFAFQSSITQLLPSVCFSLTHSLTLSYGAHDMWLCCIRRLDVHEFRRSKKHTAVLNRMQRFLDGDLTPKATSNKNPAQAQPNDDSKGDTKEQKTRPKNSRVESFDAA